MENFVEFCIQHEIATPCGEYHIARLCCNKCKSLVELRTSLDEAEFIFWCNMWNSQSSFKIFEGTQNYNSTAWYRTSVIRKYYNISAEKIVLGQVIIIFTEESPHDYEVMCLSIHGHNKYEIALHDNYFKYLLELSYEELQPHLNLLDRIVTYAPVSIYYKIFYQGCAYTEILLCHNKKSLLVYITKITGRDYHALEFLNCSVERRRDASS
jgi:hypothetical protein